MTYLPPTYAAITPKSLRSPPPLAYPQQRNGLLSSVCIVWLPIRCVDLETVV